jgi:REP element-mobilizing transposase RayT
MKLDSNNHSVFLLHYHLVLVVKYRREVFTDEISDFAKDMFIEIGKKYNITLTEWNHDKDHIHILFNDSSLDIFLYFFTNTTVWQEYLAVRQNINLKIMEILEELEISVAFTSRSIYLENIDGLTVPGE